MVNNRDYAIIEHEFVIDSRGVPSWGRAISRYVWSRPSSSAAPWGIKWYDGTVYPFDRIESYSSRSWALGRNKRSESWRVIVGDGTCRDICHYQNSWYVVHDPDDDTPAASAPQK